MKLKALLLLTTLIYLTGCYTKEEDLVPPPYHSYKSGEVQEYIDGKVSKVTRYYPNGEVILPKKTPLERLIGKILNLDF